LTPEEVEDGRINDAYQPVYHWKKPGDCGRIIDTLQSKVIPMAERSKFATARSKFLFLSYREIGNCDLATGHFAEADSVLQRSLKFVPVWPGTDDSAYPNVNVKIAVARMHEKDWKGAEEPLQRSISSYDSQIEKWIASQSKFMKTGLVPALRRDQEVALNMLAVTYYHEQRYTEALKLLERAYAQATKFKDSQKIAETIVHNGVVVSIAALDPVAIATWSGRALGITSGGAQAKH
jgi:tetratricopeptide (TPR) repeat protein